MKRLFLHGLAFASASCQASATTHQTDGFESTDRRHFTACCMNARGSHTHYWLSLLLVFSCLSESAGQLLPAAEEGAYAWSLAEGRRLPDDTVYEVVRDADGWLWLGCPSGLFRYDGVDVVRYPAATAYEPDAHGLRIGPDGRLYTLNFRGQLFHVVGDSLRVVLDKSTTSGQRALEYGFVAGSLYVGSPRRLQRYVQSGIDDSWAFAESIDTTRALRLVSCFQGGAYAVARDALQPTVAPLAILPLPAEHSLVDLSFSPKHGLLAALSVVRGTEAPALHLTSIQQADNGTLSVRKKVNLPPTLGGAFGARVLTLDAQHYLLGTAKGLYELTWDVGGQLHIRTLLQGIRVNKLYLDAAQQLWVTTVGSGVLVVPNLAIRRTRFSSLPGTITDLASCDARGEVHGLLNTLSWVRLSPKPALLGRNELLQRFWSDGGATFLGIQNLCSEQATAAVLEQANGLVKGGVLLPDGTQVVAEDRGVFFKPTPTTPTWMTEVAMRAALPTSAGRLRLTTQRAYDITTSAAGDTLYVASTGSLMAFHKRGIDTLQDAAGSRVVARSVVCHQGRLFWVAPTGALSFFATRAQQEVQVVSGMTSVRLVESGKALWALAEEGLFSYRVTVGSKPSWVRVGARYALPQGPPTALVQTENKVLLAYGRDVLELPLEASETRQNSFLPDVVRAARPVVSAVEVAGQVVATQPIIAVEAQAQSLRVTVRSPSYAPGEAAQVFYRLIGLDTTWRRIANPRAGIYLQQVPQGEFELQLRTGWSSNPVRGLMVVAEVAFWRKPSVYAVAALSMLALLGYRWHLRAQRKEERLRLETEVKRSQLSALAAQMNPHFTFNALNSVQDFIYAHDAEAASEYLASFARLVRLTLNHSGRDSISLAEELQAMKTYTDLERVRFDGELNIVLRTTPDLPQEGQLPPLVVQPFIENAIKHGLLHKRGGRQLLLHYGPVKHGVLAVTVHDNGIGRTASEAMVRLDEAQHNGFALTATQRRIELLQQTWSPQFSVLLEDLQNPSGESLGTRVTLAIPLRT